MVQQAYSLLVEDSTGTNGYSNGHSSHGKKSPPRIKDKEIHSNGHDVIPYGNDIYKGLTNLKKNEAVRIRSDICLVKELVEMAEPEFNGDHQERHAKTIETAQKEICICVGKKERSDEKYSMSASMLISLVLMYCFCTNIQRAGRLNPRGL